MYQFLLRLFRAVPVIIRPLQPIINLISKTIGGLFVVTTLKDVASGYFGSYTTNFFGGQSNAWIAIGVLTFCFVAGVPLVRSRRIIPHPASLLFVVLLFASGAFFLAGSRFTRQTDPSFALANDLKNGNIPPSTVLHTLHLDPSKESDTAIFDYLAKSSAELTPILEALIQNSNSLTINRRYNGFTPLGWAIEVGNTDGVKSLLTSKTINLRKASWLYYKWYFAYGLGFFGKTEPLYHAASKGDLASVTAIASELLRRGIQLRADETKLLENLKIDIDSL